MYCPLETSDSCSISCSRFQTTDCNNITIFVSGSHSHGFFDFSVTYKPVSDTVGNGIIAIECTSDFKQQTTAALLYNASLSEFQCIDGSASVCCPFGGCLDYDSAGDQSGMQFDQEQLETQSYFDKKNLVHLLTNDFMMKTINSSQDTMIECDDPAACLLSVLLIYYPNSVLVLECSGQLSCLDAKVIRMESAVKSEVTIICSGSSSCKEMRVNLTDFLSFAIFCTGAESCHDMEINLLSDQAWSNQASIHCVVTNACDDIVIRTDSELTQLLMYEHSDRVTLDNGIGFLSDIPNIRCNQKNRSIRYDVGWFTETVDTIKESILDQYDGNEFPCSGVSVLCNGSSCDMTNQMQLDQVQSDLAWVNMSTKFMQLEEKCYYVGVETVQQIFCKGECKQSPTESPTASPTAAPSTPPSTAPSYSPSKSPTPGPTSDPSRDPTNDPSAVPTDNPTMPPTIGPTRAPTAWDAYDSYFEAEFNLKGLT